MIHIIPNEIIQQFIKINNKKNGIDLIKMCNLDLYQVAAIKVNNKIFDIRDDLSALTIKDNVYPIYTKDKIGQDILRHSSAHLLAQSMKKIYNTVKLGTGPTTETGFFYDFEVDQSKNLSRNELKKIEEVMREFVDEDILIEKKIMKKKEAIDLFKSLGEDYKLKILDKIQDEEVSIYTQGDFVDLCRGPHLYSTKSIGNNFYLANVSSVDWQFSEEKELGYTTQNIKCSLTESIRLQRIQGIAFENKDDLENHKISLENSESLNHKKIGLEQEFYIFHPELCSGAVFWEKKGFIIFNEVVKFIRSIINDNGYFEVKTPILYNDSLWKSSGHWYNYRENMFLIPKNEEEQGEDKVMTYMCPKPMNCPAHITLFNSRKRSYRDLPLRMAEFGCCCRNESSGSLDGMMRMREFTQDDAHIFCEENQIKEETINFCLLLKKVYKQFGFENIKVVISTRPSKSFGTDENWNKAEQSLINAIKDLGWDYNTAHGEGAFYGPKLEFSLKDRMGRYWQCGTFQVDFVLPERMGAKFTNHLNEEAIPVICHRAILGSLERFLAILIEHHKGQMPFWLCPIQINILPISEKFNHYAKKVLLILKDKYRVHLDDNNETLPKKIKNSIRSKIPYLIVLGQQEEENNSVTIQNWSGKRSSLFLDNLETSVAEFIAN